MLATWAAPMIVEIAERHVPEGRRALGQGLGRLLVLVKGRDLNRLLGRTLDDKIVEAQIFDGVSPAPHS